MNFDLLLGIWLGLCLALVICAKLVSWAILASGRLFLKWIYEAMK